MNTAARTLILTALVCLQPVLVWACNNGSVRDAAFAQKRDMHRLCVIANKDDADANAAYERLRTWFEANSGGMNVAPERVNADDPQVRWPKYGLSSAPSSLPVTLLVGISVSLREVFLITHWNPWPTAEQLSTLKTSPALEAAKKRIVDDWAVVLYSPGAEADALDAQPVLDALSKKWKREHAPGFDVVRLDRSDPREALFCAFGGIEPDGPAWAGVLFGRGKLLAPPLRGEDISEENLDRLLEGLTVPCTCIQDALNFGLDVPMVWEKSLDDKFAAMEAAATGYHEITLDKQMNALAASVPEAGRGMYLAALAPIGLLALLVAGVVGWMIWRHRRQAQT